MDPSIFSQIPAPVFTAGGSALAGVFVGKALKLIGRITAIAAGLLILALGVLDNLGIISINYQKLQNTIQAQASNAFNYTDGLVHHLAHGFNQNLGPHFIAGGIGFMAGLAIGIRK